MGMRNNQKDISKYLQKPFLKILCQILPISWFRYVLMFFGESYYKEAKNEKKKIIKEIIKMKPFLNIKSDVKTTVKDIFLGIYTHYLEKYITGYYNFNQYKKYLKKNVTFKNKHLLDNLISQNQNIILTTGHFGAVEFLPLYLALNGYKVRMIAKGKTKNIMKAYKLRARKGNLAIIDGNSKNVFYKAINWLKQGHKRILIIMGDEFSDWRLHKKEKVNFLNKGIYPDKFIELLYKKSKSAVLSGFLLREGINKYKLILEDIPENNSGSIMQNILASLDKNIRNYPEQWYQWPEWAQIKDKLT